MLRSSSVLLVFLLLAAAPIRAQQQQGDVELQFTGEFQSTFGSGDVSTTMALALAKVGYFLSDRLQVGVYPGLQYTRVSIDTRFGRVSDSERALGGGLFTSYSFLSADATTVPYLGGQLYYNDVVEAAFGDGWLGVNGGVKVFVNRYAALDLGGNVLFALDEPGRQMLLLQVGLSFLL